MFGLKHTAQITEASCKFSDINTVAMYDVALGE